MHLSFATIKSKELRYFLAAFLIAFPLPSLACGVTIPTPVFFRSLSPAQLQEPFVARVRVERELYHAYLFDKPSINPDFPLQRADVTFYSGYGVDIVIVEALRGTSLGKRMTIRMHKCRPFGDPESGTEWYISGKIIEGEFVTSKLPGLHYRNLRSRDRGTTFQYWGPRYNF